MADTQQENIFEEQLIRLEEIQTWDTNALKDYCRKRGINVSGTRAELCAQVYFLYNTRVPENPTLKEQEASRKDSHKALVNAGGVRCTDPAKLKAWIGEESGLKNWPPVCYAEIVKFVYKKGHSLTADALKSYKTGKAFSYFYNDFLKEVLYYDIKKTDLCFLKADCTPSNRLNDPPHTAWIKVKKSNGEIVSAYCTCVAGLSETCNHVAALLFKIESAFRLDMSNPTCTTSLCSWKKPKSKVPVFLKISDMKFRRPSHAKGKEGKDPVSPKKSVPQARFPESIEEIKDNIQRDFINTLRSHLPNASLFLPGHRHSDRNLVTTSSHNIPEPQVDDAVLVIEPPEIEHVSPIDHIMDFRTAAQKSSNQETLLNTAKLTVEEIRLVEEHTREQSTNPNWSRLRRGRITASNFYRVYTKVNTLAKDPKADCSSLVNCLIDPPQISHLHSVKRGISLEPVALESLKRELINNGHIDLNVRNTGLYIHQQKQFVGASPDGLGTCECCGDFLVEIKCVDKDQVADVGFLEKHGRGHKLKMKHSYYGQTQGQMLVCGVKQTWFYVFARKDTHLQLIKYDEPFATKMLSNIEYFFLHHLAPALMSRTGKKRSSKEL